MRWKSGEAANGCGLAVTCTADKCLGTVQTSVDDSTFTTNLESCKMSVRCA
jgi:hypothetical protein